LSKPSQSTLRRSRHVFFTDENLGSAKLPGLLRAAGYKVVTHFERYGNVEGIKDPQVIADCGRDNTVLLTADSDLETTWAAEIEAAKIHVVILNNNQDGAVKWADRLQKGHATIIEHLRRHQKPCVIRFGKNAKVSKVRLYGKRRAKTIVF